MWLFLMGTPPNGSGLSKHIAELQQHYYRPCVRDGVARIHFPATMSAARSFVMGAQQVVNLCHRNEVPGSVLLGLLSCRLRYDSRLSQRAAQEYQYRIVPTSEAEASNLLPREAHGGTQFMVGAQESIH